MGIEEMRKPQKFSKEAEQKLKDDLEDVGRRFFVENHKDCPRVSGLGGAGGCGHYYV